MTTRTLLVLVSFISVGRLSAEPLNNPLSPLAPQPSHVRGIAAKTARILSASEVPMSAPSYIVVNPVLQFIYWLDDSPGRMYRANADGSNAAELPIAALQSPSGLAIDVDGALYFADRVPARIRRVDFDGGNPVDLVTVGLSIPEGVALDSPDGKMYWTDAGTDKIQRANLDGTEIMDLVVSGLDSPGEIAVDSTGGKMYWVDTATNVISRADLDGDNIEVVVRGTGFRRRLALDTMAGKIYWTEFFPGFSGIRRADLNGGMAETVVSGLDAPLDVAVDASADKLYWTEGDLCSAQIHRANLDASADELLVRNDCPRLHVTCMPIGGPVLKGGEFVDVECFVTPSVDQPFVQLRTDFPCTLSAEPGSTGSLTSSSLTTDPDGDALPGPSSQGVHYVLGNNVTSVDDLQDCRITRTIGGFAVPEVPAGQTRYFATIRFQAEPCSAGDFNVVFEGFHDPPRSSDTTLFAQSNTALPFVYAPLVLTVATGACCNGTSCLDTNNEVCCQQEYPGARWFVDRTCNAPIPCPCSMDAECDDALACTTDVCNTTTGACEFLPDHSTCDDAEFCNGQEICDPASGCVTGLAPCGPQLLCDEAFDECTVPPIPAISQWGLIWMALLMVTVARAQNLRAHRASNS